MVAKPSVVTAVVAVGLSTPRPSCPASRCRIAVLGDSLTAGYGLARPKASRRGSPRRWGAEEMPAK